ncbi:MAG: curli production assembly/transport protein CsgG [Chromatiales bacterium]|nr:curli production assembly/transport protein CsgG [Chromatiales bacterium]
MNWHAKRVSHLLALLTLSLLAGCSHVNTYELAKQGATLSPRTSSYTDLISLPSPKGRIVVSIYNFRDQTGQYKPSPASAFSTAVTQGATSMLSQALNDSGWFIVLEREGLQNLLTERKIIRASQKQPNTPINNTKRLPPLLSANVLLEGGVVAYDTNIKTGGSGARFLGIGASDQYRVDQVTVNLRAVDVRSGRILTNVSTAKTIISQEVQTGVFKFVEYKKLLELEAGFTTNEPTQLCVQSAIEAAVIHMITGGVKNQSWSLNQEGDLDNDVIQRYLSEEPLIL